MQHKLSTLLVALTVGGLNVAAFADEAQPELQPTRLETSWFKKPAEVTTYDAKPAADAPRDFRFVTDFSPL